MERKQRKFKRSRHGIAMMGGSGDGAGMKVCWAKGKVSSVWGRQVDSMPWQRHHV
jgi:hypothetical protein